MKKTLEDIEELAKKISELRQKQGLGGKNANKGDVARASRIGLRIGAELLSAVIVGAAIGYLADELLGTKPWFMAAFLFFGGAAGVLNVYRLAKQEDKNR